MQIVTGIHNQFNSVGPGIKRPGPESDNLHRPNTKMTDELAVTAVTVFIVAVVSDSCSVTFC